MAVPVLTGLQEGKGKSEEWMEGTSPQVNRLMSGGTLAFESTDDALALAVETSTDFRSEFSNNFYRDKFQSVCVDSRPCNPFQCFQ